ncbi:MAG: hypothetical protein ACTHLE_22840 [Agriterribacter sp.]
MQLQIKPSDTNSFPLAGILIKGSSLHHWLQQLQYLQVNLEQVPVFAIPGNLANSLWGCFVPLQQEQWKGKTLNANEPCQYVYHNLYIPQYATIYPLLNATETVKLFPSAPHLLHPEFGLVVLDTPIVWDSLLGLPEENELLITAPIAAPFIPMEIQRVEVRALPPEDLIKVMEENAFPKKEEFKDKPLHWGEKIKLSFLKALFSSTKADGGETGAKSTVFKNFLEKIAGKMSSRAGQWFQKLQESLEELERRNQSEMDKLMDLFKNNPNEALKYAIPLDDEGTGRGGNMERFELSKRRNSFELFNRSSDYGGGSSVFGMDAYQRLQQQYHQTARSLIEQKDYQKAAFVYMKLLKNNQMAAKTLEDGKMYPEAASVYLKYLQNKNKAAECYEKGQMITDAIGLYKELNEYEKVGDLYMLQQKKETAFEYYQIVADDYIAHDKYVKASLLYKNKMENTESAQEFLLKGWRHQKDAFNCINNYFGNIADKKQLLQSIEDVYEKETDDHNKSVFLAALQYEQKKDEAIAVRVREMAYEIIADLAPTQPDIVSELKNFNKDASLPKDVLRYKAQWRNDLNA